MDFPEYGYKDMVDLQHKLITEKLGLKHLKMIIGTSMGGMHTWLWAEQYPEFHGWSYAYCFCTGGGHWT